MDRLGDAGAHRRPGSGELLGIGMRGPDNGNRITGCSRSSNASLHQSLDLGLRHGGHGIDCRAGFKTHRQLDYCVDRAWCPFLADRSDISGPSGMGNPNSCVYRYSCVLSPRHPIDGSRGEQSNTGTCQAEFGSHLVGVVFQVGPGVVRGDTDVDGPADLPHAPANRSRRHHRHRCLPSPHQNPPMSWAGGIQNGVDQLAQ